MNFSQQFLPRYLVFASSSLRDSLQTEPHDPLPPRKKSLRARERHLLLYLQRIAAKNDTLSEFGPHSWGRVETTAEAVSFVCQSEIQRREVFPERWTAEGIVAAINADPLAAEEVAPRMNPFGRLEDHRFNFTDTGDSLLLDSETLALLKSCDGRRPAYSLGGCAKLQELMERKLVECRLKVPALEPHALAVLLADVSRWREGPVRKLWFERLQLFADLAAEFSRETEPQARSIIMSKASRQMETLGVHKDANRFLYTASNPIGEECFRESHFLIGEELIAEVTTEAEPWIDLWRDSYAFIAGRVASGLRSILEHASPPGGTLPLPDFLRRCAEAKLPLSGAGMVALAHLAFREVKAAFAERLRDRAAERECKLTLADCHFVRREFDYAKFDECTYPAADIQLAASSLEAVRQGDYQWILAELHPPVALLHHGFYWSCPDKPALNRAFEQTLFGKPYLYYGYFAADFTATTAVRLDALPDSVKFVAPERSVGKWETFRPGDTEVFVDESGDVLVRTRDDRRVLGSFARGWVIPLGFHPFSFSLGKHTPRLLCGKTVVQREAWIVSLDELGKADFTGVSRDLVLAVEKLRAARQLPRFVYIRPTEQALRRAGVEGRDKDTKPVFIDFESYLFLEIFHRWLSKAGELELTEMLPAPEQLFWQEADGRHSFELRTQIVPA